LSDYEAELVETDRAHRGSVTPSIAHEERIMPAIWFGTVVLWTVVEQGKQKGAKQKKQEGDHMHKHIKHEETKFINIYVHDDIGSEDAKPKIVEKYIALKNNKLELWEAYAKGLLQVVDIDHTIVTPPHIPSDDE
jgi:hypothetical protein